MLIDLYLVEEWKRISLGVVYMVYIFWYFAWWIWGGYEKKKVKMVQCYVIHALWREKKKKERKKKQQNVQWNITLYNEQMLEERRKWLEFCEVEG